MVGIFDGEGVEGPWPSRISMRVHELRICDEDKSVWICIGALCHPSATSSSHTSREAYPMLPLLPLARFDTLEHFPLTPIHSHHPDYNHQIPQTQYPLPIPSSTCSFSPPRPQPIQNERAANIPCLVGQAFGLGICSDGQAIVVVGGHRSRYRRI